MYNNLEYSNIDEKIRFLSEKEMNEIDKYFSLTKGLSKEEHKCWRLIKKSVNLIYKRLQTGSKITNEEMIAWIALSTVCKKDIRNITTQMIICQKN